MVTKLGIYWCDVCDEIFPDRTEAKDHALKEHFPLEEEGWKCNRCKSIYLHEEEATLCCIL